MTETMAIHYNCYRTVANKAIDLAVASEAIAKTIGQLMHDSMHGFVAVTVDAMDVIWWLVFDVNLLKNLKGNHFSLDLDLNCVEWAMWMHRRLGSVIPLHLMIIWMLMFALVMDFVFHHLQWNLLGPVNQSLICCHFRNYRRLDYYHFHLFAVALAVTNSLMIYWPAINLDWLYCVDCYCCCWWWWFCCCLLIY